MSLVAGVRCSFRGKDAGSADSGAIGATEDAASGRAARPSDAADISPTPPTSVAYGRTRTWPGTIVEPSRSFRSLISQTPARGSA